MSTSNSKAPNKRYLEQLESLARERYEENYQRLKFDGGRALSPHIQRVGLAQVIMYIKKLLYIAETVTDTEVKLILPNKETKKGNKYSIVGVIDIIREQDSVTLYDIKTHDPNFINSNIDDFAEQLNIYAHVWQNIRGKEVNSAAIVATKIPKSLEQLAADYASKRITDQNVLQKEIDKWNPLVPIDDFTSKIDIAIRKFAEVVDSIEGGEFQPPGIQKLKKRTGKSDKTFATNVCNNCDVRFTCESYKKYTMEQKPRKGSFLQHLHQIIEQEELEEIESEIDLIDNELTPTNIAEHLY